MYRLTFKVSPELLFTLISDNMNAPFLEYNATWGKLTHSNPNCGFPDDDDSVDQIKQLTVSQKASVFNLML